MHKMLQMNKAVLKTLNTIILILMALIAVLILYIVFCPESPAFLAVHSIPSLRVLSTMDVILAVLLFLFAYIYHREIPGLTDYKTLELKKKADRDDLTNVYNRHALMEYLDSINPQSEFTILLMNVDKFKDINEVYGYKFGDHVLQVIADELINYMKAYDGFVARYGSDEFLIIFKGVRLSESSDAIIHMRDIIHEPIKIGMASIIPTVCIGGAYSDGRSSAKDVVSYAEIAERDAKKRGRKSFVIFTEEMQRKIEINADVKEKIQDAIIHDGFYMVYQPKVDAQTKEVTGFEALVRMKKYDISPAVFIPIAGENGWLREIGRITTEKTIQQIAAWRKEDPDYHLPVSINFSSLQIRDTGYLYFILDTLAANNVPSNLVEIELTERVMLEYTVESINLMNRFHAAGIRLAMDDFGTGYSSLSYLTQFPLDIIKIDRSFISTNINDAKRRSLISDMIKLGHDLNTEIIVEGVETREQYEIVKSMHADMIQGFYFSRPLKPEDAIRYHAA